MKNNEVDDALVQVGHCFQNMEIRWLWLEAAE